MGTNPPKEEELTPQQIQQAYQQLEKEVNEHGLVLKAFENVEPTRRCFRMVGGVLVERTVTDVAPVVKENKEKIQKLVQQLQDQLAKNTEERNKFSQKYGLNERGHNEQA